MARRSRSKFTNGARRFPGRCAAEYESIQAASPNGALRSTAPGSISGCRSHRLRGWKLSSRAPPSDGQGSDTWTRIAAPSRWRPLFVTGPGRALRAAAVPSCCTTSASESEPVPPWLCSLRRVEKSSRFRRLHRVGCRRAAGESTDTRVPTRSIRYAFSRPWSMRHSTAGRCSRRASPASRAAPFTTLAR